MAEAVGLAASIIAIAGLADAVIQFVRTTRAIARDLKTVRGDLTHSVDRVGFTAATIINAQKTLGDYHNKYKATGQSKLIDMIESRDASEYLRRESMFMRDQLWQLRSEISSLLRTRWTVWITWKWRHSLKKGIEDFCGQMLYIQINLSLVLDSVRLEMELNRDDRNEVEM